MAKKKKLNTKQKQWAEHFLSNGFNKTRAARQAGYKSGHARIGWENSIKPHIQEYIEARLEDVAMGANEVMARITAIAKGFDPVNYLEQVPTYGLDTDGKQYFTGYDLKIDLIKLQEDGFSYLIKSVKQTAQGIQIVWHDSLQALIKMGEVHKLFTTKLDLGGEVAMKPTTASIIQAMKEVDKEVE